MAGNKCEFINCNKSIRNNRCLVLHRFPTKDKERCQKWIINSGNLKLTRLPNERLQRRLVCKNHFVPSDYIPPGYTRLKSNAVPKLYSLPTPDAPLQTLENKEDTPLFDCDNNQIVKEEFTNLYNCESERDTFKTGHMEQKPFVTNSFCDLINSELASKEGLAPANSYQQCDASQIRKLKLQLKNSRKQLASARSCISMLKSRIKKIKTTSTLQHILSYAEYVSPQSEALVRMQLLPRKNGELLADEKEFAVALYNKSPMAYRYLLKQRIKLPSLSIIKSWRGNSENKTEESSNIATKLTNSNGDSDEEENFSNIS